MTRFAATLAALPVRADQIDAILQYSSLAAAEADPLVAAHSFVDPDTGQLVFRSENVIPDVKVWKASQDTTSIVNGVTVVTHTYLTGYFILVSLPFIYVPLRDDPALIVAIDRDKANAGEPGAVLKSPISLAALQDYRIAPLFAGSSYPWGHWS